MSTATKTKATKKTEVKKEFKLKQVFALWKSESKKGNAYFTGKDENFRHLIGFYNTKKQNPKEPDLRVYVLGSNGELSEDPYVSLWCNASKNNKKYLSGKIDGKRVIGFINSKASEKQPYISVYWSDEQNKPEAKKEEAKEPEFEEISCDEELPF